MGSSAVLGRGAAEPEDADGDAVPLRPGGVRGGDLRVGSAGLGRVWVVRLEPGAWDNAPFRGAKPAKIASGECWSVRPRDSIKEVYCRTSGLVGFWQVRARMGELSA